MNQEDENETMGDVALDKIGSALETTKRVLLIIIRAIVKSSAKFVWYMLVSVYTATVCSIKWSWDHVSGNRSKRRAESFGAVLLERVQRTPQQCCEVNGVYFAVCGSKYMFNMDKMYLDVRSEVGYVLTDFDKEFVLKCRDVFRAWKVDQDMSAKPDRVGLKKSNSYRSEVIEALEKEVETFSVPSETVDAIVMPSGAQ